eukprot:TRINITY_DN26115_c0_g2_i1.p1 TRINITY_DN26115_c0_g2~~TRINITY_DN26115_c0_g2_i1.p1  ORF type:complete len:509 (+),score=86.43 TRINITY_DN26115_c0_g2_i1:61-1527(+)
MVAGHKRHYSQNVDVEHNVRQPGAVFALGVLTLVNMLNFADRYVASSVKPLLQEDLDINDAQSALPTTGMVVVFMICSCISGWLADLELVDRRRILSAAVLAWSLATALAGLAQNLVQLVVFRSLVGVGEAAFSTIASPMLADFFPLKDRNWVFACFGIAAPVGGAIGYAAGAVMAANFGWRAAFLLCGLPGVLAAGLVLLLEQPVRGINDVDKLDACSDDVLDSKKAGGSWKDSWLVGILCNKHWALAVAGQTANTFAIGGLVEWYDTFVVRYEDMTLEDAGLVLGGITVLGGIGGTVLGSSTAAFFEWRCKSAYFLVCAIYALPAALFCNLAVNALHNQRLALLSLLLAEICAFTQIAPMNAVTITVMDVNLRARSGGVQILLTHILGDVISPPLIGMISDSSGSLQAGLQICWAAFLVSGFCWWLAYQFLSPLPVTVGNSAGLGSSKTSSTTEAGSGSDTHVETDALTPGPPIPLPSELGRTVHR